MFNDVTRDDPVATEVSFSQCESSMYRSRRRSQPKIASNAIQLSDVTDTLGSAEEVNLEKLKRYFNKR